MLQTACAGSDGLPHMAGHPWPPKVLLQWGQGIVMALMSCISMTSIQSGNPMHLWDLKEQQIFILTLRH